MSKKRTKKLRASITHIQLDQDGFAVGVKGKLKASDLQQEEGEHEEEVFEELGIRRMN
ncbi:MAG: hypothetical protein HGA95_02215 [Caldiserica bacterium]|nr:hypothetical protein [Caldisericota bacterium]